MRVIGLLALVAIPSVAVPGVGHGESFVEAAGGLTVPIADDAWTKLGDSSPKLGLRAGAMSGDIGGMLQADWTPLELANGGFAVPGAAEDNAGHVFRVLADLVVQHRIAPRISVRLRAGAGIDIAHGSYSLTALGVTTSHSNTDLGFALELGGGAWFDLTPTIQLGGELALPIGHHSTQAQTVGDISFGYTSYDIDLLVCVRLLAR